MKNLFYQEATQKTEHISAEVWHVEKDIEQEPYNGKAIKKQLQYFTPKILQYKHHTTTV